MGQYASPSNEYHRPKAFMISTVKVGDVKKAENFDRVYLTSEVATHKRGQSTWKSGNMSTNDVSRGWTKGIYNKQGMALDWWGQTGPLKRGSIYTHMGQYKVKAHWIGPLLLSLSGPRPNQPTNQPTNFNILPLASSGNLRFSETRPWPK